MNFARIPHPAPTHENVRKAAIADPGFGTVFTDHMVTIDYDGAKGGWHSAQIGPREAIALDPAASVLHYAQEIFEGMKAFPHEDGGLGLFRPEENARRFNASARRMAMPEIPESPKGKNEPKKKGTRRRKKSASTVEDSVRPAQGRTGAGAPPDGSEPSSGASSETSYSETGDGDGLEGRSIGGVFSDDEETDEKQMSDRRWRWAS